MRPWLRALPITALLAFTGCAPAPDGEAIALGGAGAAGCEAGTQRAADDGCNTCLCAADGTWQCTDLACAEACTPGDFHALADGCNTCACAPDGRWQCTAGDCQARDPVEGEDATDGAICQPGDQGEDDQGCPCDCVDGAWQCGCEGPGGEPPSPGGESCEPGAVQPGECGGVCWCADGAWACDAQCVDGQLNSGVDGPEQPDGDDWAACAEDADCAPTGCGQRVCAAIEVECAQADPADPCYVGETAPTGCGCVEGQCAWADVPALAACVQAGEAPAED